MVPFEEKYVKYARGHLVFSWKYPDGAPRRVFIYPLKNGKILINDRHVTALGDAATGYRIPYENVGSVTRVNFLLLLSDTVSHNVDDLYDLIVQPKYTLSAIVGGAAILYSLKTTPLDHNMDSHTITLTSDSRIEEGILGYQFSFNGKRLEIPFPCAIDKIAGKKYPSFFTQHGTDIRLCVTGGSNADLMITQMRKHCLFNWF